MAIPARMRMLRLPQCPARCSSSTRSQSDMHHRELHRKRYCSASLSHCSLRSQPTRVPLYASDFAEALSSIGTAVTSTCGRRAQAWLQTIAGLSRKYDSGGSCAGCVRSHCARKRHLGKSGFGGAMTRLRCPASRDLAAPARRARESERPADNPRFADEYGMNSKKKKTFSELVFNNHLTSQPFT